MRIPRIAISAVFAPLFAIGIAALPLSAAQAQYYYPCNPFPLTWPFCIAGAAVNTAAAIATAPFRAFTPYYDSRYAPYYYPPSGYYPPGYYPPPYYYRR